MRQAIITKYLGPTNFKGGRIRATCEAKSIIVDWDHELSPDENFRKAAMDLVARMGWTGRWMGGGLPRVSGYAYCFTQVHEEDIVRVGEST